MREFLTRVITVLRFVGAILLGLLAPVVLICTFLCAVVGGVIADTILKGCSDLDYRVGGPTYGFARHTLGWCVKILMTYFNWKNVKFQIDDSVDWTWGS